MAVNGASLKAQVRDHRKDYLSRYSVPAPAILHLVNFAKHLLGSVEMARIRESRGTMQIQMRVSEEIVTVLKKLEEKDPQKCSMLTKVLGRLYHNLHIMKCMLDADKLGSQFKVKKGTENSAKLRGKSFCSNTTSSTFNENTNQVGHETGSSRPEHQNTMLDVGRHSRLEKTYRYNCKDIDLVSDVKNLSSGSMKVVSRSHDIPSLPGVSSKSIHNSYTSNGIQPGTYTIKEPVFGNGFVQEINEVQGKEVDSCQFASTQGRSSVMEKKGQGRNASTKIHHPIKSQACVTPRDDFWPSYSDQEDAKCLYEEHVPLENSVPFDCTFNDSTQNMNRLELVAVGGETISLPVGETIQVFSPENYCNESAANSEKNMWARKSESECINVHLSYVPRDEHEVNTDYISDQIQGNQMEGLDCCQVDDNNDICHIECDSNSGKTFFSL